MIYKISTSSQTKKDIECILLWYLDKSKTITKKFLSDLEKTKSYIEKNPQKIQVRYANVRIAFLKKFPYGIHFILEDNTIQIIAVLGTSESPEKWEQRQ